MKRRRMTITALRGRRTTVLPTRFERSHREPLHPGEMTRLRLAADRPNLFSGFVFTPDPNVVAYTTDLTITTIQGQLKSSNVTTQSTITGAGVEWGQINPSTSTGRFAGATGTISVVFKPVGDPSVGPYEAEITADICFAQ